MTMTRNEKSNHSLELRIASQNSGYTSQDWSRPAERAESLATVGHLMMPADAYREHAMGRKLSSATRRDVAVARVRARRRAAR